MTSLSAVELVKTCNQNDEIQSESSNRTSSHSLAATSVPTYNRATNTVTLQPITTLNTNIQFNDNDCRNEDGEHLLSLHYDSNRSKQGKLLLFSNIFRLLVICVLAPIIYFLV
ncbi:unnamed protein product [Rotaria sordida]|uniref:Uncharacterized protein n=1 Tax=Rotaria sordida TaxID=392033 RepID=A0A819B645_9BILA|nr:unnamed protein product [Rotaria sordida]CAF0995689.1 unnamed protein product [Rotaria sordida]CAF1011699.1 unnamed protein product [Rotaria sordida]CAF1286177.1 unnamed protein product [Rotaria sordida]CAF3763136.1 unnamed protein product [Rotaria sordida]